MATKNPQDIFGRRRCSTVTGYPDNLENLLMEVFKTVLDKARLCDLMVVINSLLKVALSNTQNFLEKHVYNPSGFGSTSHGMTAWKFCFLCCWQLPTLSRPAVRAGVCLVLKLGLNVVCFKDEHLKD